MREEKQVNNRISKADHRRRSPAAMVNIALIIFALAFFGISIAFKNNDGNTIPPANIQATQSETEQAKPVKITISKIGVESGIVDLGLTKNNTLEVPDDPSMVGWYVYSPAPGNTGPSVMVGHKDSTFGRAIFYELDKLEPGDKIEVERSDGKNAAFVVESSETYSQNNFPSQKVYGSIDHAGLRLITCSGKYNRLIGRYSHNLVVYATLLD